jgi:hypothetical protein
LTAAKISVSGLLDSDRNTVVEILSNPSVLTSLYPIAARSLNQIQAVDDWYSSPKGETGVIITVRSARGHIRGALRIDANELSYFVDPAHWGTIRQVSGTRQ